MLSRKAARVRYARLAPAPKSATRRSLRVPRQTEAPATALVVVVKNKQGAELGTTRVELDKLPPLDAQFAPARCFFLSFWLNSHLGRFQSPIGTIEKCCEIPLTVDSSF